MAERFSQKNLRVRPSSDEEKIVTNAKKHFEKTLVEISSQDSISRNRAFIAVKFGETRLIDNIALS